MARLSRPAPTGVRTVLAVVIALLAGAGQAGAPSAFPESAVEARVAWTGAVAARVGAEIALPARYVDASAGVDVALGVDGRLAARLSGTALLFPTLGTTPPVAFGIGADLTWRDDAVRAHAGAVAGLDLLYVSELPAVIDVYLAPGYAFGEGLSLAWSVEGRYYLERVALVLAGSDLAPLSFGVRVPF
jgi:hypothetical protein